ncbi:zinc-ribbon and DUF3426 domain-containing protein [Paraburkholderia hayleyella]|uniref:zinc-ribbon and DUF3426 domain-containing protein n=1 Tax=Paraburkholderia hayleyella TaxID=2152889 RepID=UPI0012909D2C|nr:zinc-ribbon and DUF3426 domain-containing protein [Paraburkholderia hayleyella]
MILATRCPFCETVFRLQPAQLAVRRGLVRCGHCQEAFDASGSLFEITDINDLSTATPVAAETVVELTAGLADPASVAPSVPDFSESGWNPWAPQAHAEIPPALRGDPSLIPLTQPLIPGIAMLPGDTSLQTLSDSDYTTSQHVVSAEPPPPPVEAAAPSAPEPGPGLAETTHETSTGPLAEPPSHPVEAAAPSAPEPGSDLTETTHETSTGPLAEPPPVSVAVPVPDEAQSRQPSTSAKPEKPAESKKTEEPKELKEPKEPGEPYLGQSVAEVAPLSPLSYAEEHFTVTREPRKRAPHHMGWRIIGILLTLVLLATLLLQLTWWQREAVMSYWPPAQKLFAQACAQLGCTVSPPRDIDGLLIEPSDLRQIDGPHRLELRMPLRNRSDLTLAYPAVELTLLDEHNNVALRRILWPQDYVSPGTPVAAGLSPHVTQTMIVHLDTGNAIAANFRVQIFYP